MKAGRKVPYYFENDKEYQEKLIKKVNEELEENPCEEEIADIFEVLEALMKFHNLDEDKLLKIKADKRIILEKVWKGKNITSIVY